VPNDAGTPRTVAGAPPAVTATAVTSWEEATKLSPLELPPHPVDAAAMPSSNTAMIIARRRLLFGRPSMAIPSISNPPSSGHTPRPAGCDVVSVKLAYLYSLPSITGCNEITALSESVTEPPADTVMGAGKVKVVVPLGGVTVADCPPPVSVIALNRVGWLTLIVAEAMLSVTLRLF